MSTIYRDIASGEALTEDDLYDRYDDMLDEVTGEVEIAGYSYSASYAFKNIDPIAYRCGFGDWLDSEIGETVEEAEA